MLWAVLSKFLQLFSRRQWVKQLLFYKGTVLSKSICLLIFISPGGRWWWCVMGCNKQYSSSCRERFSPCLESVSPMLFIVGSLWLLYGYHYNKEGLSCSVCTSCAFSKWMYQRQSMADRWVTLWCKIAYSAYKNTGEFLDPAVSDDVWSEGGDGCGKGLISFWDLKSCFSKCLGFYCEPNLVIN